LPDTTKKPRGRPALNGKPTVVRLPEGVGERIDLVMGPNKRAEFIRYATEKELKLIERAPTKPKP